MLVTEKVGPVWLVSAQGQKISPVSGTPAVYWQGQNGMHGVFLSPQYATDQSIYLTYAEPGEYGGGLALARAKLTATRHLGETAKTSRCSGTRCRRARAARKARRWPSRPTASICSSRSATASA